MHTAAPKQIAVAEGLETALRLTREAIAILDQIDAPADLAAHLDLAAHRINQSVEISKGR